jgi:hypothetical protein
MSLFLRISQHLLPRSNAWALTFNKRLTQLFSGIVAPFESGNPEESPRAFADAIFSDAFPATTRQPDMWLKQFGLEHGADAAADVTQLVAAWQAQGGQDPQYLQAVLQLAGFPLYVHEWWTEAAPFVQVCAGDALAQAGEPKALASSRSYTRFVRDPRDYTEQPITGTVQASALTDQPQASALPDQPLSDAFLANEPGYLVNLDLSRGAPPPVPDDSATTADDRRKDSAAFDWYPKSWSYFFYLGAATFPNRVTIPVSRRAELERLVLKLRPAHQWVVMLVDYVAVDDGAVTVGGVGVTAGGVPVVIAGAGGFSVTAGGSAVTVGGVSVSASA